MNSVCRFRISSLSHLKLMNGSLLNIKVGHIPSGSSGCMLKPIYPVQIQVQSFWETYPLKVRSLHAKDQLEKESHELIYRTKLFNYVFYAQLGSLVAFAVQTIYSSYYAYRNMALKEVIVSSSSFGPYVVNYDAVSILILLGFSCQFLLVYYVCQRPILRAYYKENTDEYVLVTLSHNPFKSRLLYCKPGELKAIDVDKTLVLLGNHKFKGHKLFLKPQSFKSPWHYNRLIGFI